MKKIPSQRNIDKCPICLSKKIQDIDLDEMYFIRPFKTTMTSKLGFCNDCNFIFHLNPLDNLSIEKYYEKNFQLRSLETDLVEECVHRNQAAFISKFKNLKNMKVLEIGPNTGRFLNHLRELHGADTYFEELNLEAKKILEEVQHHKSVNDFKKTKFDVIIMRHVLEHIVFPIDYLINLGKKLSTSGILFIEVPDFTILDSNTDTLLFEHVNYFSQLTLSSVLDKAGYDVVAQELSITKNYVTCPDRVLRVLAQKKSLYLKKGIPFALKKHQYHRVEKINELIEKIVKENGTKVKVAFYGASWGTEKVLLNTKLSKQNVIAIFDKDKKKEGTIYHGIKVQPPLMINKLKPDMIFILSTFEPQIKKDLNLLHYSGKVYGLSDLLKILEKDQND